MLQAKWKMGLEIAAERGLIGTDFPDLVRVEISEDEWVSALVSFAQGIIIIEDKSEYLPLYRGYRLDFTGTLVDFIRSEIENPTAHATRMSNYERMFRKWERIYKTAPWSPLLIESDTTSLGT